MARAAARNRAERGAYLRTIGVQMLATFLLGIALGGPIVLVLAELILERGHEVTFTQKGLVIESPTADVRSEPQLETVVLGLIYFAYGVFTLAEAVVIALSREHHDQIGRRSALAQGLEPEDAEMSPRVRLNLRWLHTKWKRKQRAIRLFLIGIPLLLVARFNPFGDSAGKFVYGVLVAGWSFYWMTVFAGAKSKQAWVDDETAPPWFPVRHWEAARTRHRWLRWWLPDLYLWVLRKATHDVRAPCRRVEEAEYALVGLALARVVCGLPFLYLMFRPFFPVAASAIVSPRDGRVSAPLLPEATPASAAYELQRSGNTTPS